MAITDFLSTKTSKDELSTTLKVIREFKTNESKEEWACITFEAWEKLEQLEEFIDHLVNNTPLQDDTLRYIEYKRKRPVVGPSEVK